MPDHPLITDDVVAVALDGFWTERDQSQNNVRAMRAALTSALRAIEGEKPCGTCAYGQQEDPDGVLYRCPDCNGSGKVRADRLVRLSEVVGALRRTYGPPIFSTNYTPADFIEREFGGPGA